MLHILSTENCYHSEYQIEEGERQTSKKRKVSILFAIDKFSFMIMWKVEISEAIKFKNYQSYIILRYLIASRLIRETKRVVKIHKNKIYLFLILLCLISWFSSNCLISFTVSSDSKNMKKTYIRVYCKQGWRVVR